jgi:hypothetical protein
MTIILTVFIICLLAVFIGTSIWYRSLNNQLIDLQLEAHKELTPKQIWQARRSFRRRLLRQHQFLWGLRYLAVFFVVIGVLALFFAGMAQWQPWVLMPTRQQILTWLLIGMNDQRNIALWVAVTCFLSGCFLWAGSEFRLLTYMAEQDGDNTNVTFWTPPKLAKQRYLSQLTRIITVCIASLGLAIACQVNWLPQAPSVLSAVTQRAQDSGQTTSSTVVTSQSSSSSSATSIDDSAAADSSSTAPAGTPLGEMQRSSLAPKSQLKNLSMQDKAILFYMAYWALNGQDTETFFANGAPNTTYNYHIIENGQHPMIVYSTTDKTTKQTTYQYYAWIYGDHVYFVNLGTSNTTSIRSMTDSQYTTLKNGTAYPNGDPITNSTLNIRQLITAFYQTNGYQSFKDNMKVGSTIEK